MTSIFNEAIEARAHTTRDGILNLSVNVGVADADMAVTLHVKPLTPVGELDAKGWPKDFFERFAGSMPELERSPQGEFAERLPLE